MDRRAEIAGRLATKGAAYSTVALALTLYGATANADEPTLDRAGVEARYMQAGTATAPLPQLEAQLEQDYPATQGQAGTFSVHIRPHR